MARDYGERPTARQHESLCWSTPAPLRGARQAHRELQEIPPEQIAFMADACGRSASYDSAFLGGLVLVAIASVPAA
jgi:hypothetical protein